MAKEVEVLYQDENFIDKILKKCNMVSCSIRVSRSIFL